MVHEIILGRSDSDAKKYGSEGTIFIGKHYVTMGKTTSLANRILLDVINPHVILVSGKRGGGKSYSLGVMGEGIATLPDEIAQKISCLFFDTMGIYWTMKFANFKDDDLLYEWKLEAQGYDEKVKVYVPSGKFEETKSKNIPVDKPFSIGCNELTGSAWSDLLKIDLLSPVGILITRITTNLLTSGKEFGIDEIITNISKDTRSEKHTIDAAVNSFEVAKSWGIFSKKGTGIHELLERGKISVLDISMYAHSGTFSVRALVIGLIARKILEERIIARKLEELDDIERGWRYFKEEVTQEKERQIPLVWIFIDEAHEFLPREGTTLASNSLIQLIREGRQPGISLVLATQQPGKIHTDVITQSDLVISHRLTARIDIEALNNVMQTYLTGDLRDYLSVLPAKKGSAIVLDDKQEKIYPIQIRPRITWHGGGEPSLIKPKRKRVGDLE